MQVDEQLEQLAIHSALNMKDISLIPGEFKVFQIGLRTRLVGCNPEHRPFPRIARENEPGYTGDRTLLAIQVSTKLSSPAVSSEKLHKDMG